MVGDCFLYGLGPQASEQGEITCLSLHEGTGHSVVEISDGAVVVNDSGTDVFWVQRELL